MTLVTSVYWLGGMLKARGQGIVAFNLGGEVYTKFEAPRRSAPRTDNYGDPHPRRLSRLCRLLAR
jgi:hypothetical protein